MMASGTNSQNENPSLHSLRSLHTGAFVPHPSNSVSLRSLPFYPYLKIIKVKKEKKKKE
jgi:hypothetical protein